MFLHRRTKNFVVAELFGAKDGAVRSLATVIHQSSLIHASSLGFRVHLSVRMRWNFSRIRPRLRSAHPACFVKQRRFPLFSPLFFERVLEFIAAEIDRNNYVGYGRYRLLS